MEKTIFSFLFTTRWKIVISKMRVYYFNTSKDKNSYATALKYSICYNTMKRLFGKNILLEFNVITLNNLIKMD